MGRSYRVTRCTSCARMAHGARRVAAPACEERDTCALDPKLEAWRIVALPHVRTHAPTLIYRCRGTGAI